MAMRNGLYFFTFVGKNSPGVTNVDTYWFGYYGDRQDYRWTQIYGDSLLDIDSGIAFSWQNRPVPAHGIITLSALIGVGEPTVPPDMNMTNSDIHAVESDGAIYFTGKIFGQDINKTYNILLTVDGDTSHNFIIATNISSGELFSYKLNVSETNLVAGVHTFTIWAEDPQVGLSNAGVLNVTIFTSTPITLNPNVVTEIPTGQTSVSFNGRGEIARYIDGSLADLILNDIRLNPYSNVIAQQLLIARSLRLIGSSILSAASSGYIRLEEAVQILFDVVDDFLPTLNLGFIPTNVNISFPSVFQVTIPSGYFQQKLTFPLVSGSNFNCEKWKSIVNIPIGTSNTSLWCGTREGRRTLEENNEQTLYLTSLTGEIPTSNEPPPINNESKGLSGGVIAGIVISVLVVGILIAVGIIFFLKKNSENHEQINSPYRVSFFW